MEPYKNNGCQCEAFCAHISGFKHYPPGTNCDIDVIYYSSHFNVGSPTDLYRLPVGLSEGQVLILRLITTASGTLKINVDHLSGNMSQLQMSIGGSHAVLHWKCNQWHLADCVGVICI